MGNIYKWVGSHSSQSVDGNEDCTLHTKRAFYLPICDANYRCNVSVAYNAANTAGVQVYEDCCADET
jgi:hypothetical protein